MRKRCAQSEVRDCERWVERQRGLELIAALAEELVLLFVGALALQGYPEPEVTCRAVRVGLCKRQPVLRDAHSILVRASLHGEVVGAAQAFRAMAAVLFIGLAVVIERGARGCRASPSLLRPERSCAPWDRWVRPAWADQARRVPLRRQAKARPQQSTESLDQTSEPTRGEATEPPRRDMRIPSGESMNLWERQNLTPEAETGLEAGFAASIPSARDCQSRRLWRSIPSGRPSSSRRKRPTLP